MIDSQFQNLSTVQSGKQPTPVTFTAAATIAPTTFLSFISGTTVVGTITPPVNAVHMLAFVFSTTASGFSTAGNVKTTVATPAIDAPVLLIYNPLNAKYYPLEGATA